MTNEATATTTTGVNKMSTRRCEFYLPPDYYPYGEALHDVDGLAREAKREQCPIDAPKQCLVCNRYFCASHESPTEQDYCCECVNDAAGELRVQDQVRGNDDTVGKLIEPVGPYFVSTISDITKMTEPQREEWIATMTAKVRQMEQAVDRGRIAISVAKHVQEEAFVERAKRLKGKKIATPSGKAIQMPRRVTARNAQQVVDKAVTASTGLTKEEWDLVVALLKKKQKEKQNGTIST